MTIGHVQAQIEESLPATNSCRVKYEANHYEVTIHIQMEELRVHHDKFQIGYFSRVVQCSSLRDIEVNINLSVQCEEGKKLRLPNTLFSNSEVNFISNGVI